MRGAAFTGDKRVSLIDVPDPTPGTGEVVVKIAASGMCGSDLHYFRASASEAPEPVIAGHEPAGVVAAVGTGVTSEQARVGDRVMVHHYTACGSCTQCATGWPQLCQVQPVTTFGKNGHGGHAPYIAVPAATLVPLDNSLSFVAGAAISCGTGTAWGGLKRLGDVNGSTVAVFGQGPVGLSATMLASALGARVIAVDLVAQRREQALAHGAEQVLNPLEVNAVEVIHEHTQGEGVQFALETSGSTAAGKSALDGLATWGKVAYIGLGSTVQFDVREVLRRQLTVMTSYTMSLAAQKECARFVAKRGLPVDDLFSDRWRLDQAQEAYDLLDAQSVGKGVFVFD